MDRVPGLEPSPRECPSQLPCSGCGELRAGGAGKYASRSLHGKVSSSNLQQELYHNQELCDVAINVTCADRPSPAHTPMAQPTTVILAHRIVLAAHSPSLRAIFASSPSSPVLTPSHVGPGRSLSMMESSTPTSSLVRYPRQHTGLQKTGSAASDGADSGHGHSVDDTALVDDGVFMSRPIMSIDVHDTATSAVRAVLDFAYSGSLSASIDRVEELLKAATVLGFKEVEQLLRQYLSRQPPAVMLRLLIAAHLRRMRKSSRSSAAYMEILFALCEEQFEGVATCPELLSMPFELFHTLLGSNRLVLQSEELVLQTILQWTQHQKASHPNGPDYLSALISLVRLPFVSAEYLTYRVLPLASHIQGGAFRDQIRRAQVHHRLLSPDPSLQLNCAMFSQYSPRMYQPQPAGRLLSLSFGGSAPNDVPGIETLDLGKDGQSLHLRWRTVGRRSISQYHPAVVMADNILYVIGGSTSNRSLDTVQSTDVFHDNGKWTNQPAMLARRDSPCAAVFNKDIYVIGGCTSGQTLDLVERFSWRLKRWCLVAPMSTPRAAAGVATNNALIFVVGGCVGSHTLASVECYDVQENEWYPLPDMLVPRISPCVVFVDKCLMVFGGHSLAHVHCSAEYYDAPTRTWRTLANMKIPRTCATSAVVNGKVLVAGGHDGFHRLGSIDEYDIDANTWHHSSLPALTSPDSDSALFLVPFNGTRETIC